MALNEEDRDNHKLLEMLIRQDPVSTARILAMANSSEFATAKKVNTLSKALQLMGGKKVYNTLLTLWLTPHLDSSPERQLVQSFLVRHIFLVSNTMRRIAMHTELDASIGACDMYLFALLDKISVSLAMAEAADTAAYKALLRAATTRMHSLHQIKALSPYFQEASHIAKSWLLSDAIVDTLAMMGNWTALGCENSVMVTMMLLAEELCTLKENNGQLICCPAYSGVFLDDDYIRRPSECASDRCNILSRLAQRKIDPLSLVTAFD